MPNDTKELRGDAPTHLVAALDALALSNDMTRNAYVNDILARHVKKELHRVTVITRAMRGNPMLTDAPGQVPDSFTPTRPAEL